jgi:hypothetical protein
MNDHILMRNCHPFLLHPAHLRGAGLPLGGEEAPSPPPNGTRGSRPRSSKLARSASDATGISAGTSPPHRGEPLLRRPPVQPAHLRRRRPAVGRRDEEPLGRGALPGREEDRLRAGRGRRPLVRERPPLRLRPRRAPLRRGRQGRRLRHLPRRRPRPHREEQGRHRPLPVARPRARRRRHGHGQWRFIRRPTFRRPERRSDTPPHWLRLRARPVRRAGGQ